MGVILQGELALAQADNEPGHGGQCGARGRQGNPCQLRAGHGTDHLGIGRCKHHGGSTPTQRAGAAAQLIEQQARQLFGKTYDDQPIHNPLAVYAQFTGKVMGWMSVLEQLVADLKTPRYSGGADEAPLEQIRGEVQLFERALDRCNTVLSTYARLGIDERLARISEAQSFMVMQAIEAALAAAGVSGARAIEAKRAAAKRLRVVEGTAIEVEPA